MRVIAGNALGETALIDKHGGALLSRAYHEDSRVELRNCVFEGNRANVGGAVFVESKLLCRGCLFAGNIVNPASGPPPSPSVNAGSGGAIYSAIRLEAVHCRFEDNAAVPDGLGGAISVANGVSSDPEDPPLPFYVTDCVFVRNSAGTEEVNSTSSGGAIYAAFRTRIAVTGCLLHSNFAKFRGGAICCDIGSGESILDISSCTIARNTAVSGGGVFVVTGVITNSVIVENVATGGGTECGAVDVDLCAQIGPNMSKNVQVDSSCIPGILTQALGDDNVDVDPLFVDADEGIYRLETGSPVINAGDGALIPLDITDADGDFETTTEDLPEDLSHNARVIWCRVDMGAFESGHCEGDANGDATVGGGDITVVLGDWGTCATSPCLGDVDCSGVVDGADMTMVLGNWGPCPALPSPHCALAEVSEEEMLMSPASEGGGITPETLMAIWGFEDLGAFVEWLESLDFEVMATVLSWVGARFPETPVWDSRTQCPTS